MHDLEFPNTRLIGDVRAKLCELTGLRPEDFRILARGREQQDNRTLSSLSTIKRPIKLMIVEKVSRRVPISGGFEASAAHCAVDAACGDLPSCSDKVRVIIDFTSNIVCNKYCAHASQVVDMTSAGVRAGGAF